MAKGLIPTHDRDMDMLRRVSGAEQEYSLLKAQVKHSQA